LSRSSRLPFIRSGALLDFLEALYRWDASAEDWLRSLCAPLLAMVPAGLWAQLYEYDVSDSAFQRGALVTHRAPPSISEHFRRYSAHLTPEAIARWYRASWVTTVRSYPYRSTGEGTDALAELERETGTADVLVVNGLDASGRSATLNVGISEVRRLSENDLRLLRRVASHLAAAARVRRRIMADTPSPTEPTAGAAAVFSAEDGGRLLHAEVGADGREQREWLTEAVRRRESTRADKQRGQPLAAWQPLVDTRWTLVDTYESNGARYIVARENRAEVRSLDALSERERQVVAGLALGQSTKEIAYGLGIDASTVRVLLQRAATKLAVTGRDGLLDHPAVQAMRGGIDAAELRRIRAAERGEG
jgi:DNA-binding CsgD family transcriptional regulator